MKIDLFYFTDDAQAKCEWNYGDIHLFSLGDTAISIKINEKAKSTDASWILLWDSKLGVPPLELILELVKKEVDAWHSGLKLGYAGIPRVLNYIDPAWLYNKDVDINIVSSSFRLSIRACLFKTKVYSAVNGLTGEYVSVEMAGVALGYKLLKSGAIIRYHPGFLSVQEDINIPEKDEWNFLRQFFTSKWQYWVLLNKKGLLRNYRYWRETRGMQYIKVLPTIHSSNAKTQPMSIKAEVSVLAPTLDRYSYLHNELIQLSYQTILPKEVLITDQTDKERRQSIQVQNYPRLNIKYIPQSEKGQCVAWNTLLSEATGEYVLFLGDDADNISHDFIEKLLHTMKQFDADIVASNVIEIGSARKVINHHYYMSDTFPITLAKKECIIRAGGMDMFFNRNIRADYDLAMRCHSNGALMIFDSSAVIDHHRAPIGGLRTYNARSITNAISKKSITKFAEPTSSEIFLVKKHFSAGHFRNYIRIKYFDQLLMRGSALKKSLRFLFFVFNLPAMRMRYVKNLNMANKELAARNNNR